MADIKTREVVKGTIKTLNKQAIGVERFKKSYAKTRSVAEANDVKEDTPSEYASAKIEQGFRAGRSMAYNGLDEVKRLSISNRRRNSKSATQNRETFQKNRVHILVVVQPQYVILSCLHNKISNLDIY